MSLHGSCPDPVRAPWFELTLAGDRHPR
jgi:hypothetical protein